MDDSGTTEVDDTRLGQTVTSNRRLSEPILPKLDAITVHSCQRRHSFNSHTCHSWHADVCFMLKCQTQVIDTPDGDVPQPVTVTEEVDGISGLPNITENIGVECASTSDSNDVFLDSQGGDVSVETVTISGTDCTETTGKCTEPVKPPRTKRMLRKATLDECSPSTSPAVDKNYPSHSPTNNVTVVSAPKCAAKPQIKPKPVPKPRISLANKGPTAATTDEDMDNEFVSKMTRSESYERALEDDTVIELLAAKNCESQVNSDQTTLRPSVSNHVVEATVVNAVHSATVSGPHPQPQKSGPRPTRAAPPPPLPKPKTSKDIMMTPGLSKSAVGEVEVGRAKAQLSGHNIVNGCALDGEERLQKPHLPQPEEQLLRSQTDDVSQTSLSRNSSSSSSSGNSNRSSHSRHRERAKSSVSKTSSIFYYPSPVDGGSVSSQSVPQELDTISVKDSSRNSSGMKPQQRISPTTAHRRNTVTMTSSLSASDIAKVAELNNSLQSSSSAEKMTENLSESCESTNESYLTVEQPAKCKPQPRKRDISPGLSIIATASAANGRAAAGGDSSAMRDSVRRVSSASESSHVGVLRHSSLTLPSPRNSACFSDLMSPIQPAEFNFQGEDEEAKSKFIDGLKRKAYLVAKEIVESEETFISILRMLNKDFKNAINQASQALGQPVLPEDVEQQIIRFLPQLQLINEDLLKDLKIRLDNWEQDPRLGDIFVKKGPFLKMYSEYINQYEPMVAAFDEARRRYPEFDKAVSEFESRPLCNNLALRHHMLKPIQRIPQYRLLLRDYLKHLMSDSPDYENTQAALRIVSDVAEHANQRMKYLETVKRLKEIQSSLIGHFEVIKPGRDLLKQGVLNKLCRKELQPRYFLLFNDVLLCTTQTPAGYKINKELPLADMKVVLPAKEDFQNEFSIITKQRSFTISASSEDERAEWVKVIEGSIKEQARRRYSYCHTGDLLPPIVTVESDMQEFKLGSMAPVWITDDRVSMCMLCKQEFWFAVRRHHCRACGKVVCHDCSNYRAPLKYLDYQPDRVCEECFETLEKEVQAMPDYVIPSKNATGASKMPTKHELRALFRGYPSNRGKNRQKSNLLGEIKASEKEVTVSGYLSTLKNKRWKKMWFVIKDKVLYTFKAAEDTAAEECAVLLGYEIHPASSSFPEVERSLIFELRHTGMPTLYFRTENQQSFEKWLNAMRIATVP